MPNDSAKTNPKRKPTKRGATGAVRTKRQRTGSTQPTRKQAAAKKPATKTAVRKSASTRSTKASTKKPTQRGGGKKVPLVVKVGVVLVAVALVCIFAVNAAFCTNNTAKRGAVEQWRDTVKQACIDTNLGTKWTDAILAAIYIESGGDKDVYSVLGVEGDIMQAAEGKYGNIVKKGSDKYGVKAETPEASIYAGVLEFKHNLKLWKNYLGKFGPEDTAEIQLVIQGYNFGADGWLAWCEARGVTEYTVELAQEYSDDVMPADAKGTPTHAQKWLEAYNRIHKKND